MLLDEMTAPGKIPILAQAISYLPGYNVRFLLVIQAFSQLREVYGPNAADTMMKSLAARVLYAPKDFAEANEISQELGFTTVKVKSFSKPRMAGWSRKTQHGNISVSEQKRALLLPQEVKELGRDNELVLYEGLRPILAKKKPVLPRSLFKKRLFPPPKQSVPRLSGAAAHPRFRRQRVRRRARKARHSMRRTPKRARRLRAKPNAPRNLRRQTLISTQTRWFCRRRPTMNH